MNSNLNKKLLTNNLVPNLASNCPLGFICHKTTNVTTMNIYKMKRSFLQAAVVSILLYGCTTWTQTKRLEKKLDGNYARMLWAIKSMSWRQHPTKQQLYGHLPPITKTIQVRRTRHVEHCSRSWEELWTPTYGRSKAG